MVLRRWPKSRRDRATPDRWLVEALERRTLLSAAATPLQARAASADVDQAGSIAGASFADIDADGTRDPGEPGLSGRTVYLDLEDNGRYDFAGPFGRDAPYPIVPGIAEPDPFPSGTFSAIAVRGVTGPIHDVNVTVDIRHTDDQSLSMFLLGPDDTRVNLVDHVGGSGDHFLHTTFDDDADTPIESGSAPFAGSYKPKAPLSAFDGRQANGLWTLTIYNTSATAGTLNSWSMDFGTTDPSATTDAAGNYTFTGLAPGNYTVRQVPIDDWTPTAPPGGAYDVSLAASGVVTGRDFGEHSEAALPTLSINDLVFEEGVTNYVTFTVTLAAPSTRTVTVGYRAAPGGSDHVAFEWLDFVPVSNTLTFAPGQTSETIKVPVVDDALDEWDETFVVNLFNPAWATVADAQGLAKVLDNEAMPSVGFLGPDNVHRSISVAEGTGDTWWAAIFTVDLTAASGRDVTLNYTTFNGTAHDEGNTQPDAGPADYTRSRGTITIPAGATSWMIAVPVSADDVYEPDETFRLNVFSPTNAQVAPGALLAQATIINDDAPPAASITGASSPEGAGPMVFTVTLSNPSSVPTWIAYVTADGTAAAGSDYTGAAPGSTVFFNPYATTATISVPLLNDSAVEGPETFTVALTGPANGSAGSVAAGGGQATGTILDDDTGPPPVVTQVFVAASAWTPLFRNSLQQQRLGDATFGDAVPAGTDQFATLPWGNLDRISVRFDRPVVVRDTHLAVWRSGSRGEKYAVAAVDYDRQTNTATWTLARPLGNDRVLLDLDGDAGGVAGAADGARLDGDWAGGRTQAYPSGDGQVGGDFRFRINTLPGDADRGGRVDAADLLLVRRRLPRSAAGSVGYSAFADLDGDGTVNVRDEAMLRRNYGRTLPPDEPAPPAAASAAAVPQDGRRAPSRRDLFGEQPILA